MVGAERVRVTYIPKTEFGNNPDVFFHADINKYKVPQLAVNHEPKKVDATMTDFPIEANTTHPLVIRGHHLGNLWSYYYNFYWGAKRTTSEFVHQIAESVRNDYADTSYAEDVLGNTLQQADNFLSHTEAVVRRFLELPDDHPLELVEGVPDEICAGCAIGEHCRKLSLNSKEKDEVAISGDRKWIDWLLGLSQYLSGEISESNILVQKELAFFSDGEPQEVRRIRTTVETIRNAMPYFF